MMKTSDRPVLQEFHLEGVRHILPEDAWEAQKAEEVVIADLREKNEIYASHIKDTLFLPIGQIAEWLPSIPKDKNLILMCNQGIRSTHMAFFLINQGYRKVMNLDGGITSWKEMKLPHEKFKWPEEPSDE